MNWLELITIILVLPVAVFIWVLPIMLLRIIPEVIVKLKKGTDNGRN